MDSSRWARPRSKSAFDISTATYDNNGPGVIAEKTKGTNLKKPEPKRVRSGSSAFGGPSEGQANKGNRRLSLVEKAMNNTLKEDIKRLWARRSSLNLFKSNPKSPASDEEELKTSLESLDCLMQEVGGFFVVDRQAWQKEQERPKRSFSLFRNN